MQRSHAKPRTRDREDKTTSRRANNNSHSHPHKGTRDIMQHTQRSAQALSCNTAERNGAARTAAHLGLGIATAGALLLLQVVGAVVAPDAQRVRLLAAATETEGTLGLRSHARPTHTRGTQTPPRRSSSHSHRYTTSSHTNTPASYRQVVRPPPPAPRPRRHHARPLTILAARDG